MTMPSNSYWLLTKSRDSPSLIMTNQRQGPTYVLERFKTFFQIQLATAEVVTENAENGEMPI